MAVSKFEKGGFVKKDVVELFMRLTFVDAMVKVSPELDAAITKAQTIAELETIFNDTLGTKLLHAFDNRFDDIDRFFKNTIVFICHLYFQGYLDEKLIDALLARGWDRVSRMELLLAKNYAAISLAAINHQLPILKKIDTCFYQDTSCTKNELYIMHRGIIQAITELVNESSDIDWINNKECIETFVFLIDLMNRYALLIDLNSEDSSLLNKQVRVKYNEWSSVIDAYANIFAEYFSFGANLKKLTLLSVLLKCRLSEVEYKAVIRRVKEINGDNCWGQIYLTSWDALELKEFDNTDFETVSKMVKSITREEDYKYPYQHIIGLDSHKKTFFPVTELEVEPFMDELERVPVVEVVMQPKQPLEQTPASTVTPVTPVTTNNNSEQAAPERQRTKAEQDFYTELSELSSMQLKFAIKYIQTQKSKYIQARDAVWDLHTALKTAADEFFQGTTNYKTFKETCEKAIERNSKVINEHRNVASKIAKIMSLILFPIYLIGATINWTQTGKFTFFQTRTATAVDKVEELISAPELTNR